MRTMGMNRWELQVASRKKFAASVVQQWALVLLSRLDGKAFFNNEALDAVVMSVELWLILNIQELYATIMDKG